MQQDPPSLKLETYLRLTQTPYILETSGPNLSKSSTRKPYISLRNLKNKKASKSSSTKNKDEIEISDPHLAIEWLEKNLVETPLNDNLDLTEVGAVEAYRCLLELGLNNQVHNLKCNSTILGCVFSYKNSTNMTMHGCCCCCCFFANDTTVFCYFT
jgi:hypothetical protein